MKVFHLTILVLMVASETMKAQNFTQQLKADVPNQGKIEIEQDERLTDILNGGIAVPSNVTTSNKPSIATESKVKQLDNSEESKGRASGVMQRVKGYRIQVFFGSNQRSDQTKAQQVGSKLTHSFPELRAYTSFESPHWRCRVGDFTNREEANSYLRKIKARGFSEAIIVRSEIYVSRDHIRH